MSMGFPKQEYWSGLTFHSPGDLPNPGIGPVYPALSSGFFTPESPGKPYRGILPSNKNEDVTYTCLNEVVEKYIQGKKAIPKEHILSYPIYMALLKDERFKNGNINTHWVVEKWWRREGICG